MLKEFLSIWDATAMAFRFLPSWRESLEVDALSACGLCRQGSPSGRAQPGQANVSSPPLSPGEGTHAAVNDIGRADSAHSSGTLTVSFNTPVFGAGLFLIDLFNPPVCGGPCDDVSISAFTGTGGTGSLLGTFHGAEDNFQPNHLYFMGISSSGGDIGSIVFTQPVTTSGDGIALGNVEFGRGTTSAVPEPESVVLLLTVIVGLAVGTKSLRRKSSVAKS